MNGLRPTAAVCFGGCLLCLLGGPGLVRAASVEAVLEAIRQRAGRLASFTAEVKATETRYPGDPDQDGQPPETLSREHWIVVQNGSFRETSVVKSARVHGLNIQHDTSTFPQEDGSGWVRQDLGESNGRKSLLVTHAGVRSDFTNSCAWDAFLGAWGPTEYRNHPVALWGQDAQAEHYTLTRVADGGLLLRHQPDPRSDVYEMHVREDLGYLVTQVSRFAPEGMLLEESRVTEYTVTEGVVVPQQIAFVAYGVWEGRPYRCLTRSLRINVLTLKPDLPDTYFRLKATDRGVSDKLHGLEMASHELQDQDYLSDLNPRKNPGAASAGGASTGSHTRADIQGPSVPQKSLTYEDPPARSDAGAASSVRHMGSRWRCVVWLVGLIPVTALWWFWQRQRKGRSRERPLPERSA